jgi:hypothetical protein
MYGIEREIELMYSRHVPLPSGGSLVIDSTEAIVAIDVNSGKFRDHNDAEMTAYKTDLEAADEIPRQLRLRDLGGVIICDFIDLRFERHRRDLEKRLHENLRKDRAKTKMLRMSQFGIIEMTRQRMRPSLKRSIYADCPYCKGAGLVKTPESMALDVMRRLAIAISDNRVASIDLAVSSEVAFYLNNKKRAGLADLEIRWQKRILIRSDATLAGDAMSLQLFDSREGLVFIEELGMFPQPLPVAAGGPPRRGGRNDHRQDRRDRYDRGGQQEQRGRREEAPREAMEDRFDIDSVEDAVDRREEQMMDENTAAEPLLLPSSGSQSIEAPPADMDSDLEAPSAPIKEAPAAPTKPALRQPAPLAQPAPARPPVAQRQPASAGRGRSGRSRPGRGQAPRAADQPQSQPPAVARKPAPLPPPPLKLPAPSAPPVEEPVPALDDEQPAKRRRTRRGTRGRGGHSRKPTQPAAESAAAPAAVAAGSPSPSSASPVRTGSTDRHLMRDEPVLPQPIARPRTYRDLDHIPDDLD